MANVSNVIDKTALLAYHQKVKQLINQLKDAMAELTNPLRFKGTVCSDGNSDADYVITDNNLSDFSSEPYSDGSLKQCGDVFRSVEEFLVSDNHNNLLNLEVGDLLIYLGDTEWTIVQNNIDLTDYYTKNDIDGMGFITESDIPSIPQVINNVTSTSTTDALSAAQGKALDSKFNNYVPETRTVNGKALSGNITLSASDVGAVTADNVTYVKGSYTTTNLGQKIPNQVNLDYRVLFHMSNLASARNMTDGATVDDGKYQDWVLMNCYNAATVPYLTMIGVSKSPTPQAFIASANKLAGSTDDWTVKRLATTEDLKKKILIVLL